MSPRSGNRIARSYDFKVSESMSLPGWWIVKWKTGSSSWEVVASVFGEKRAEAVRDALSAEANRA